MDRSRAGSISCVGGGARLFVLLMIAVAFVVAAVELTKHLNQTRAGDSESRIDTWFRLERQVRGRHDNDGFRYYAASCMFAKVRSIGNSRFGESNPHFKLAACKGAVCDYAIIGVVYDSPAVVTARCCVPEKDYLTEVRKDACLNFDVGKLMRIIDGDLP